MHADLKRLLILAGLLIAGTALRASHYLGAELTYRQLSPTTYRVYVKIFYDCAGTATTPLTGTPLDPAITFGSASSGIQLVALTGWVLDHYEEISQVCPGQLTRCTSPVSSINGVSESLHHRDYDFAAIPSGTDVTVAWTDCCRGTAIVSGSEDNGLYVETVIRTGQVNSAPVFVHPPVLYLCAGQQSVLNQSAWDPDGDSLVYSLVSGMQGPLFPVTYYSSGGYSPTSPLGGTWLCSLHPATGDVTCTPNVVGAAVNGVMAIRVSEYRNGQLLGAVTRDCLVTVVPCSGATSSIPPFFSGITNLTGGVLSGPGAISTLPGRTISFDITITDPDPGQVVSAEYRTDLIDGTVTLTPTGTNPMTLHVAATVSGNPGARHHLGLTAKDDFCILPKVQVAHVWINTDSVLFAVSGTTTATPCDSSAGSIDLTVSALYPPVSYLWSTGDTTEDVFGLPSGIYTVLVSDQAGNSQVDTFMVEGLDLFITPTPGWVNCLASGGMLSVAATGGVPPVAYHWNTGDTTATISGLAAGVYQITAEDSAGCFRKHTLLLEKPDSCVVKFTGTVYVDIDNDCQQDSNDLGLPYTFVQVTPWGGAFTDAQGHWTFKADTGAVVLSNYAIPAASSCASNTLFKHPHTYGIDSLGNDFPRFMPGSSPFCDLSVSVTSVPARPGFYRQVWLSTQNQSLVPASGVLNYRHDPHFQLVAAAPTSYTYDSLTHTLQWAASPTLQAFQKTFYQVSLFVPSSVPLGQAYTDSAWVVATPADTFVQNNLAINSGWVVGSYDPNFKEVTPPGTGPEGFLPLRDSLLTYTIHFQNTGTDTAFFVTLRDTLDTELDLTGCKPLNSSHPFHLLVEGDHILVFRFDHINLPDSGRDEPGSHGFVTFQVPFRSPVQGAVADNRAAIYFDFNAPIITNTVRNTLCDPVEAAFTATRGKDGGWQMTPAMKWAEAWHWDFGSLGFSTDSVPAPLYLPDTGSYPISLTVSNTCSEVEIPLLLHEVWLDGIDGNRLIINIQPNPVGAAARIQCAAPLQEVLLLDPAGRVVQVLHPAGQEATLVRGDLPAGVYYVRVRAADGRMAGQAVVLE